ncbi:MAG: hypothetical protein M5R42_03905 [Rhodocyclaceae bacterium]|nr:hypothetical protein [Rhodocyclaceae bacterium]
MAARILMRFLIAVSVVAVLGADFRPRQAAAEHEGDARRRAASVAAGGASRHGRGDSAGAAGAALQGRRTLMDFETIAQLVMFCVAFGMMALAFFSDSL